MSRRNRYGPTHRVAVAKPSRLALSHACKYLRALPHPPGTLLCRLPAEGAGFAGGPSEGPAGILAGCLPRAAQPLSNALLRARKGFPAGPRRTRGSDDSRVVQLFPSGWNASELKP